MSFFTAAMSRLSSSRAGLTRAQSDDSLESAIHADASSNVQSSSSTPPTSAADSASVSSQSLKLEIASSSHEDETEEGSGRPRRARTSTFATYNVQALTSASKPSGRASRTFADGADSPIVSPARRRTISGETLVATLTDAAGASTEDTTRVANELVRDGIEALDMDWSVKKLPKSRSMMSMVASASNQVNKKKEEPNRRISTRSAGIPAVDLAHTLSSLGKRARDKFEEGIIKSKRELKRLADTNEFAKIEDRPIFHTVWSKGKYVPVGQDGPPARKKSKYEPPVQKLAPKEEPTVLEVVKKPEEKLPEKKKEATGPKVWLNKGLYAGQVDLRLTEPQNKALPLPIFTYRREVLERSKGHKDFKLPFDVCNPLPPGQPKPDEWKRMPKNRFVGNAAAAWKTSTLFDDFSSRCVCKDFCDDSCQNRIMLYECDTGNCRFGAKEGVCQNRSFAELAERKVAKKGIKYNKYNIGVEVIKTLDRGYGVRANRCFKPHQIITEYTGEIITESECDRRMNEDYTNNACYYLMSFDQNTILDATEKGSIARFVNHSCEPNCRMVKWVVGGKPRMALFAGESHIMTGDELTYDYNFDPFSAKNVQECRCGSFNCRGVLGPRPKDPKFLKSATVVSNLKSAIGSGKRKLKDLLAGNEQDGGTAKKRKILKLKGVKRSMSTKALDAVAGLGRTLSKSVAGRKGGAAGKQHVVKRAYKRRVGLEKRPSAVPGSRNSSLTIVASNSEGQASGADGQKIRKKPGPKPGYKRVKVVSEEIVKIRKKPGPKPGYKRMKALGDEFVKKPKKSGYIKKGGWGGKRVKGCKKGVLPPAAGMVTAEDKPATKTIVESLKQRFGGGSKEAEHSTIRLVEVGGETS